MHILKLGERNALAQDRILSSSKLLAIQFSIDPTFISALKVQEKDPLVRALKEREAVADLLDTLVLSLGLAKPDPTNDVTVVTSAMNEVAADLPAPVVEDDVTVVTPAAESKPRRNKVVN